MKQPLNRLLLSLSLALLVLSCGGLDHSQHRSIHDDARNGDAALVSKDLADNPGDLNLPDDAGLTPLHLAASYCHTNVMILLLDKGASIEARAKGGATPLHIAAQEGCADGVQVLLSHGANANARDDQGSTPLTRAEQWHQAATAEILRKNNGK